MHARTDLKAHLFNKRVSIWGENRNSFEDDLITDDDFSLVGEGVVHELCLLVLQEFSFLLDVARRSVHCIFECILFNGVGLDLDSLVLVQLKILKHFLYLIDQTGIACQALDFFVRDHYPSDSLGKVDQQGRVPDIVLGDFGRVTAHTLQIPLFVGPEYGETKDGISNHDSAVLDQHGVVDSHEEPLEEHAINVHLQRPELRVDLSLLPVTPIVKCDFFRVVEEVCVLGSVVSFQLLLLGRQFPERGRN
mmetsp:Transcript_21090/g.20247  ORF Transcript_21090/g.20247 Transcript_21090/m.20247 type:complete len:249 (-) Transcript_21090:612-1358(-)